jgi:hypothetical protein
MEEHEYFVSRRNSKEASPEYRSEAVVVCVVEIKIKREK